MDERLRSLGGLQPGPISQDNSPGPPRARAAIQTLGCRLNLAESNLIRARLESAGYQIVPWGEAADVLVLNSCTVTSQAGAKTRKILRTARREHPEATLAVTGCHAQLHGESLAQAGLADTVVGNAEKLNLAGYLGEPSPSTEGTPRAVRVVIPPLSSAPFSIGGTGFPAAAASGFPDAGSGAASAGGFDARSLVTSGEGTRAHLKIQDGCDFMCAFCVIPRARGRSRPRTLPDLVAEAEALAEGGVKEIVVTGVNVGAYGEGNRSAAPGREDASFGQGLMAVMDALDAIPGLERLRIGSIEPTTVPEGLLERMAARDHLLTPFLHLPLQSGSARVLEGMRRRYGPEEYRAFAASALELVPALCLGADVMTGFPGEDDEAFAETQAFLESLDFAYFHVFPYSPRPGTAAFRMEGKVRESVRTRRAALLRALSERKRESFHRRFLGQTMDVLFERPRAPERAEGYTANYIRVEVHASHDSGDHGADGSDAAGLHNRILPVRLLEAGPSRMVGELVAGA